MVDEDLELGSYLGLRPNHLFCEELSFHDVYYNLAERVTEFVDSNLLDGSQGNCSSSNWDSLTADQLKACLESIKEFVEYEKDTCKLNFLSFPTSWSQDAAKIKNLGLTEALNVDYVAAPGHGTYLEQIINVEDQLLTFAK
eukprot:Awhi_evm1s7748